MVKHDKTLLCSCKSVKNDVYGWDKGTNTKFKNTKNGAGSCSCEMNNNKTGKRSKKIKMMDIILTQQSSYGVK